MKPKVTIADYIALVQQFLDKKISGLDFREEYNKLIYREQVIYSETLFRIKDKLFAEVDAYDPDTQPGDPDEKIFFAISEQALRQYAAEALEKLKAAAAATTA
jgi:hypothetical protein